MAAYWRLDFTGRVRLGGVTAMEDGISEVTVRTILPEIFPEVAVMVVVPLATDVARPPLLTVATVVWVDLQLTSMVISRLLPSEYVPEAVKSWVTPIGMLGLAGVIDMEVRLLVGPIPPLRLFPPPPQAVANTAQTPNNNIVRKYLLFLT